MNIQVYVAKHERYEAIDIYRDKLTKEQIEQIQDLDDDFMMIVKKDSVVIFTKGKDER